MISKRGRRQAERSRDRAGSSARHCRSSGCDGAHALRPLAAVVRGLVGTQRRYGVDIFFVLSGYLIGSELLRPVHAGQTPNLPVFYIKRVFRILPVFRLVLAAYVFFPALRESPTMAPAWRFPTFTLNFGLNINTARAAARASWPPACTSIASPKAGTERRSGWPSCDWPIRSWRASCCIGCVSGSKSPAPRSSCRCF